MTETYRYYGIIDLRSTEVIDVIAVDRSVTSSTLEVIVDGRLDELASNGVPREELFVEKSTKEEFETFVSKKERAVQ